MMDGMMNGICAGGMMGCGLLAVLVIMVLLVVLALLIYAVVRLARRRYGPDPSPP